MRIMYPFIALFDGKRFELHADSLYAAKEKAVAYFKPPKSRRHMVHVHPAIEN